MADVNQSISILKATSSGPLQQRWKEFSTGGYYARLTAGLLYGMSTGGTETGITVTTGGNLHSELQGSTEKIGALYASTEQIGHIILDASTARMGSLYPSTEKIGALLNSTEQIGHVVLDASTARVGSLYPSTEKIGSLLLSTEQIGHVVIDASTAVIGSLYPSTEVIGAIYPSTNAIGQVGGHTRFASAALAVTTSQAYSSGDVIGGAIEFTSAFRSTSVMTGTLQSLVVTDASSSGFAGFELWLFHTKATGTYTNDAAFDPPDADLTKLVGKVRIYNADYDYFTDNGACVYSNLGLPVHATTGTSLHAVARNLSTGPAWATTGDLNVLLGILAD